MNDKNTQKCPKCQKDMQMHLDKYIMCSMPPQQGFTWICADCSISGERGSYALGTYEPPLDISGFTSADEFEIEWVE